MKKYSSSRQYNNNNSNVNISSRLRMKMNSWKRARGEQSSSSYNEDVERLRRENKSLMEKVRLEERSVGQRMLQTIEKLKRQGTSSTLREDNERLRRELAGERRRGRSSKTAHRGESYLVGESG